VKTYLHCIYCKVKQWIYREMRHIIESSFIWWNMVETNSTLLLEKKINLSFIQLSLFKEYELSLSLPFFKGGKYLSTHCFNFFGHLSNFYTPFFFCIAHTFFEFSSWETLHKTWSNYLVTVLYNYFRCFLPV
jgi:hypothetical protein